MLAHRDALPNFQDISVDQYQLTDDDRWKTFFFYGYGFRSDANCARCPETTRLIEAIPGMETAMFSILAPGKHIPPHDGPYKGVLRYHLGLIGARGPGGAAAASGWVPRRRGWREGESLVFDDTYEHEVWNETDETRVVLFLDVVRPLRQPMRVVERGHDQGDRVLTVHPGRQASPPGVGSAVRARDRLTGSADTNLSGALRSRRAQSTSRPHPRCPRPDPRGPDLRSRRLRRRRTTRPSRSPRRR